MYETCFAEQSTICVMVVAAGFLALMAATFFAMWDRGRKTTAAAKKRAAELFADNQTLRQENGALRAELRSYRARSPVEVE